MTPEQANQIAQLYDQGIKFKYHLIGLPSEN